MGAAATQRDSLRIASDFLGNLIEGETDDVVVGTLIEAQETIDIARGEFYPTPKCLEDMIAEAVAMIRTGELVNIQAA